MQSSGFNAVYLVTTKYCTWIIDLGRSYWLVIIGRALVFAELKGSLAPQRRGSVGSLAVLVAKIVQRVGVFAVNIFSSTSTATWLLFPTLHSSFN
jgi:hypothetical protein